MKASLENEFSHVKEAKARARQREEPQAKTTTSNIWAAMVAQRAEDVLPQSTRIAMFQKKVLIKLVFCLNCLGF